MRKNFTYQLLATFAIAASLVQADTITLKDGTVLEGEVVSETDTEYVIAVAYSKSIRTRKTFKKSDIADIKKEAPDLKPYEELKGILPTPDQLSVTAYDQLIEARVKPFLNSFPKSQYAKEVQKMLDTLEAERERAKAGDIKLDDKWVAADEWNANALELDAQLLVKKMKGLAARRLFRPALLIYDKINQDFRGSDAAKEAAEIAAGFLPTYGAQVKNLLAESTAKIDKRKKALAAMTQRDAARMKKAYDEAEATHQKAVAAAKESRIKWLPITEYHPRELKAVSSAITQEIANIERQATRTTTSISASEAYRQGWKAASEGNAAEVRRAQANLRSNRINSKYSELLDKQLAANPAPEKETGPTAAEMKAAADKKAAEEAKVKAEEEKKKKAEEKERERERRRREAELADDEPVEEESSSSVLPIIIAVILLGLLITFLVIKRKQSEE